MRQKLGINLVLAKEQSAVLNAYIMQCLFACCLQGVIPRRSPLVDDGAEPDDEGGLHPGGTQEVGTRQVADVMGHLGGGAGRVFL